MKLVILLSVMFSTITSFASYLPESCENLGGYAVGQVVSTAIEDLYQNQTECTFKVELHHGNSTIDYNCQIDWYDVDAATYVDPSCSVKVGDQFNHTVTQYFSSRDMQSRGLFYWIDLGGYLSQNVFPNYGK